jgi:hypothetical protein
MGEISHLRIIFPLGFDYKHMIKTFWSDQEGCLMGSVLHKNDYWRDNILDPAFSYGMEVHVGVEREAERDLLGRIMPVPARGIMRGEYFSWEPYKFGPRLGSAGYGWLNFILRYDMQEGPEVWTEDWQKTYTQGQAPAFYYALERRDE